MAYIKLPIGSISSAPSDGGTWLQMNGQVVSQATYAELFKIIGHQPEFDWKMVRGGSTTSASNFSAFAYGNSTYVGVGGAGQISTSSDLVTWTSRTSGVASALNVVVWDSTNSLFIAAGASNVILTSPDGVTWTSRTSGVTSTLNCIYTSGGRTVIAGTSGWITYSTDGTTWTATQPNSSPSYAFITKRGSDWFLTPTGSVTSGIAYSSDGITFTFVGKPTTGNMQFLGFDATYFYVTDVTNTANNTVIYRSTTGATWSSIGIPSGIFYGSIAHSTGAPNPVCFSSGVISIISIGQIMEGYTDDGFTTTKRLEFTNNSQVIPSVAVVNPMRESVPFAIAAYCIQNSNDVFIFQWTYSVDGKKWSSDKKVSTNGMTAFSSFFKPLQQYVNGYYILGFMGNSGFNMINYAPAPYDPSTQFQIPTNKPDGTNALYIKAL